MSDTEAIADLIAERDRLRADVRELQRHTLGTPASSPRHQAAQRLKSPDAGGGPVH